MIKHAVVLTVVICLLTAHAGEVRQEDWSVLRQEIVTLRHSLARDGAYAFVTTAATPKVAPHIHSQCWVDWLPKEEVERRLYEQEKRAFGLDMVGQLESYALADTDWQNDTDNAAMAHQLLAISKWLKTSAGYGNYLLYKWAENMMVSLSGRLAVNPHADVKAIERLLSEAESYQADLAFRIAVLKDEVPQDYFAPSDKDMSAAQNELLRQWGENMRTAMLHYGEKRFWNLKSSDVLGDKREFAVYVEDPLPRWHTIRSYWDASQYRRFLICGLHEPLCDDVRCMLSAREKSGPMPVPPASAFKDSKARHIYVRDQAEKCSPYLSAAHTAFSIFNGDFYDIHTWQIRGQSGKNRTFGK